jgi:hypothetical protein
MSVTLPPPPSASRPSVPNTHTHTHTHTPLLLSASGDVRVTVVSVKDGKRYVVLVPAAKVEACVPTPLPSAWRALCVHPCAQPTAPPPFHPPLFDARASLHRHAVRG